MKYSLLIIAFFFCFCLNAQGKTFTLSELDSITERKSISEHDAWFKEKDTLNFEIIERVPIYKGCEKEKSNLNKKDCMSQKIAEVFKQHYNTTLPKGSKIPSGRVRIFIKFRVDEEGKIVDSIATGPDKYLENEALRVLKLLPKLSPGYYMGKPIKVPFSFLYYFK